MKDLWTVAAYPVATLAGYFIALGTREELAEMVGLDPLASTVIILIVAGLAVGFLVDEVIPAYLHERSAGGGDFSGGGDFGGGGDFDFE